MRSASIAYETAIRQSRMSSKFSPLSIIRCRREVIRAKIYSSCKLLKIYDNEFVVHADAAGSSWLRGEWLRNVLRQRQGKSGETLPSSFLRSRVPTFLSEIPYTKISSLCDIFLISFRMSPFVC